MEGFLLFFSLILLIFENIAHYEKGNLEIHSADYREHSHSDSNDTRGDKLYVRRPLPRPDTYSDVIRSALRDASFSRYAL